MSHSIKRIIGVLTSFRVESICNLQNIQTCCHLLVNEKKWGEGGEETYNGIMIPMGRVFFLW